MKRIAVLTNNPYLYRRAELELAACGSVTQIDSVFQANRIAPRDFDVIIRDTDFFSSQTLENEITVGHSPEASLTLPLPLGALIHAMSETEKNDGARLKISEADRGAILDGGFIRLTELEYTLLSTLVSGDGEFISREHIRTVLGDKGEGLINVYVHYLREKLETGGEKIILSSRKNGYAIDRKFLKEDG